MRAWYFGSGYSASLGLFCSVRVKLLEFTGLGSLKCSFSELSARPPVYSTPDPLAHTESLDPGGQSPELLRCLSGTPHAVRTTR
mmetsp:Transcript_6015/g.9560  ORF Transcript_6015/g.9560 Transcript_6015/m.9560 type:complete len:84 (-) Transcript_6015:1922-2173(-)